jgi:hypothetical protein
MEHDLPGLIRRQHADLRELIVLLERQPAVTEQILEPQLRARDTVLRTFERRFLAYQAARMRYLWPALRAAWPDGRSYTSRAWERTRLVEYRMLKRRWLGERDRTTTDLERHMVDDVEELLTGEERQLARLAGPAEDVGFDATEVAEQMRTGGPWPTRPHPDVPGSLRLAATLQRPLALADRVLDRCAHVHE